MDDVPEGAGRDRQSYLFDMDFPPANAERAVQLLLSAVGLTEAKSGCQACTVARDASDPNRVRYSEIWHSESAFQKHAQSDDFRRVLVAMDMRWEEPRVVIGNLSGRSGMAYLQELRAKNVSED